MRGIKYAAPGSVEDAVAILAEYHIRTANPIPILEHGDTFLACYFAAAGQIELFLGQRIDLQVL